VKGYERLKERFPFVDVFSPPSDPGPLVAYLTQDESRRLEQAETQQRFAAMDGELLLPVDERGKLVASHVPVVLAAPMPVRSALSLTAVALSAAVRWVRSSPRCVPS